MTPVTSACVPFTKVIVQCYTPVIVIMLVKRDCSEKITKNNVPSVITTILFALDQGSPAGCGHLDPIPTFYVVIVSNQIVIQMYTICRVHSYSAYTYLGLIQPTLSGDFGQAQIVNFEYLLFEQLYNREIHCFINDDTSFQEQSLKQWVKITPNLLYA